MKTRAVPLLAALALTGSLHAQGRVPGQAQTLDHFPFPSGQIEQSGAVAAANGVVVHSSLTSVPAGSDVDVPDPAVDFFTFGGGSWILYMFPRSDVIVLGGGLSNIDELYDDLPGHLPTFAFSDECATPIRRNVHGDSSGVRGAARSLSRSA